MNNHVSYIQSFSISTNQENVTYIILAINKNFHFQTDTSIVLIEYQAVSSNITLQNNYTYWQLQKLYIFRHLQQLLIEHQAVSSQNT